MKSRQTQPPAIAAAKDELAAVCQPKAELVLGGGAA
jgi:hypothetical protein